MRYICASVLWAVTLLLVCPASSRGANGDSLTVDKAIALVVQNHPALQKAAQQIEASRARVGVSESSLYPEVTGIGAYNRIGPVPTVTIPNDGSFDMAPADNWNVILGINQLVYDFGQRGKGIDLAKSGIAFAKDNEELIKSQLVYAAVNVFYSILYLQQDIRVIDDHISDLNRLLEITKEKVRTGSATDFDILTTQARVAATQTRKIEVERRLNNQVTVLKKLTGLPADQQFSFAGDFSMPIVSPPEDSLLAAALSQRPEMRLTRDAEATAALRHELASLSRRPKLNVGVQLGFKNGYFPDLNKLEANFVAGASISMPIFTGFRIESQQQVALADLYAARAHTQDIGRQVTAEVREALEDLRAGVDKIQTAEIQVRQAEEALRMGEVRYEAGVITNLDLLDSQTRLSEARLAYINAQYGYVLSRYALDRATGAPVWGPPAE